MFTKGSWGEILVDASFSHETQWVRSKDLTALLAKALHSMREAGDVEEAEDDEKRILALRGNIACEFIHEI